MYDQLFEVVFLLTGAAVGIFVWLLPVFVAHQRHHNNTTSITLLTVFLGWTFLGWVVALVWAFSNDTQALDRSYRAYYPPPEYSRERYAPPTLKWRGGFESDVLPSPGYRPRERHDHRSGEYDA